MGCRAQSKEPARCSPTTGPNRPPLPSKHCPAECLLPKHRFSGRHPAGRRDERASHRLQQPDRDGGAWPSRPRGAAAVHRPHDRRHHEPDLDRRPRRVVGRGRGDRSSRPHRHAADGVRRRGRVRRRQVGLRSRAVGLASGEHRHHAANGDRTSERVARWSGAQHGGAAHLAAIRPATAAHGPRPGPDQRRDGPGRGHAMDAFSWSGRGPTGGRATPAPARC